MVISASGSQSFSWPEVDEGQVYVKNDRDLQTFVFLFGNPVNFKASSAFCNIGMILTLKVRWAVEGGSAGEWHKPGGRIRRMVVGLVDRMDMDGCNLMLRMKTGRSLCFRYLCLVLNWPKEMFWLERLNKVGCNKVTSDCSYGRSTF